jgi:hypothetical protein
MPNRALKAVPRNGSYSGTPKTILVLWPNSVGASARLVWISRLPINGARESEQICRLSQLEVCYADQGSQ